MNYSGLKRIVKLFLPERARIILSGLFYGWHGNYKSWDDARSKCTGYNSDLIIERVRASAIKVKEGSASYERDSLIFDEIQYSYPLLSGLMWIAARNGGILKVLDFGGALGTSYFQNRLFLDKLPEVKWCVIEQAEFVKIGRQSFEDEKLHFFFSPEECLRSFDINVVLLSSVLQYLEDPFELLDKIKSFNIKYLIIDRTPFIQGKNRITVQKVNPRIYKASYPCWFLNKPEFIARLTPSYNLIHEFDALDRANIRSEFKGFLMQKISEHD